MSETCGGLSQISKIENGRNVTFSTIARLFNAMNIRVMLDLGSMGKFQFVFLCISKLNRNSDLRSKFLRSIGAQTLCGVLRHGYTKKCKHFFVYLKT